MVSQEFLKEVFQGTFFPSSVLLLQKKLVSRNSSITKTRLISIESQPKKIVVVVVVVIGAAVGLVHVVVVVIPVFDPRNIPLKFGSNQVINR